MRSELMLPDPQSATLARLPEILAQARLVRIHCGETQDMGLAQELRRRLDAVTRYISDKKARKDLEGETRLVETLIGKLLGPAVIGENRYTVGSHDAKLDGISKDDRSRFRVLAEHEEVVEELVADGTTERAKILRHIARQEVAIAAPPFTPDGPLRLGDFREVLGDVPDESVDLIFTDPPYAKEFIPLYEELAAFGARVLKPGGSLLAYCGQYALPTILADMSKHLRYWWMCACVHDGGNHKSLPGVKTYVLWKPIVWFVKGTNGSQDFVYDAILRPAPAKDSHDWEQALNEPLHYIEKLTHPQGLVLDPFAGGGMTLVAAKTLGRQYLGAEIDERNLAVAAGRLEQ